MIFDYKLILNYGLILKTYFCFHFRLKVVFERNGTSVVSNKDEINWSKVFCKVSSRIAYVNFNSSSRN